MTDSDNKRLLPALAANLQAEMEGHYTYSALAKRENDPQRRNALRGLAAAEKHHAGLWAGRILELGGQVLQYTGDESGQADSLATRVGGADLAFRRLEIDEGRDSRRSLPAMSPEQAQEELDSLLNARKEGHPQAAGWVGDAIYGVNDGPGSIFGIVSGVSGATLGNSNFVLIAGLAGIVARALSVGSGAYLAAKSEREIFEAEFAREREAVEDNEAEAREVLSLTNQIRGLPEEDADRFVEHLAKNKEKLVKALARERLNTTEEGLSKPLVSAVSGALSTAVGALIPIIPFFFMAGIPAVIVAAIVSLIAHFAVGASKSLVTIGSWWSSGLEMTIVAQLIQARTDRVAICRKGLGPSMSLLVLRLMVSP